MEQIKLLIQSYLNHEFDIIELKNRLSTLYFENDANLESEIRNLENDLESVIFCCNLDLYYIKAKEILDLFLSNHI